jgi:bla regulator protein BlaR1
MIELLGNHLWQSTLFAGAVGLLISTLRRNRASVRHWLWLAASVKFLVPFAALVAIGGQFGWPSATMPVRPGVAVVVDAVGRPFSLPATQTASARAAGAPGVNVIAAVPVVPVAIGSLVGVWLIGCVALAVAWSVRWRRVAAVVRRGLRVEDGPEVRALRRLEKIGGFRRPIDVVACDGSLEPGVFGIRRPVLLWPLVIAGRLDDQQVETILLHELCHVRRRDNLAAALHGVVQALFWFHPFVWWVGDRLVNERERACDEDVVRLGSDPRVYAESILRTCQCSVQSPRICVAGVTGSDLKKRIARILTNESAVPLNAWRRVVLGTAGCAALAVPVAIGVASGPRLRAQPPSVIGHRPGFGPNDLNRLLGFELWPGIPPRPTDDPRGAVAWRVAIDHPLGRMSFVGFTGRGLIRYAYGLRDLPVLAGPSWIDTESLEMSAATSAQGTDDEFRSVLRTLFENRIRLSAHHQTRDVPVYALVPARGDGALGPNLRRSTSACKSPEELRGRALLRERYHAQPCGVDDGLTGATFEKVTMTELADGLSRMAPLLDRKVVDRTGLSGSFDATLGLGFLPASSVLTRYPAAGMLLEPLGVRSIFSALPDQLGLRLDDAAVPGDVLVIDRAERLEY